ncbi:MAG: class I SAM-dependent methyltransferase [Propylenella sp.]
MGTAQVQGELWGAKARDWAEAQEPAWRPVYASLLTGIGVRGGVRLLDIGCGAGGALMVAREAGAMVSGFDASAALAAIAHDRLPGAQIEVGEMEALPFADETFDVVVAFNAFQFAESPRRALGEAQRVCRRGGTVATLIWGRPEDCQLMTGVLPAVLALLPSPPADAPTPVSLSEAGVLAALMKEAGLSPAESGEIECTFDYPDLAFACRAISSAGPIVRAEQHAGEDAVRRTLVAALGPFVGTGGQVKLSNRFSWISARR